MISSEDVVQFGDVGLMMSCMVNLFHIINAELDFVRCCREKRKELKMSLIVLSNEPSSSSHQSEVPALHMHMVILVMKKWK